MILRTETAVHDLPAGRPGLRPYLEVLLPAADPGIGAAGGAGAVGPAERRRLIAIADGAHGADLTHRTLLPDLQAEAARLGVADGLTGPQADGRLVRARPTVVSSERGRRSSRQTAIDGPSVRVRPMAATSERGRSP